MLAIALGRAKCWVMGAWELGDDRPEDIEEEVDDVEVQLDRSDNIIIVAELVHDHLGVNLPRRPRCS